MTEPTRPEGGAQNPDDEAIVSQIAWEDVVLPEPPAGLQAALWRKTSRSVRFRPWRRRIGVVAVVLAAYVAGVLTVHLIPGETPGQPSLADNAIVSFQDPASKGAALDTSGESLPADPRRLETTLAALTPPERSRILREAGDRYLSERVDVVSALYCYRKVLEAESRTEGMAARPDESWLLAVLRNARTREVSHGASDG